jgi:hypothetical protein
MSSDAVTQRARVKEVSDLMRKETLRANRAEALADERALALSTTTRQRAAADAAAAAAAAESAEIEQVGLRAEQTKAAEMERVRWRGVLAKAAAVEVNLDRELGALQGRLKQEQTALHIAQLAAERAVATSASNKAELEVSRRNTDEARRRIEALTLTCSENAGIITALQGDLHAKQLEVGTVNAGMARLRQELQGASHAKQMAEAAVADSVASEARHRRSALENKAFLNNMAQDAAAAQAKIATTCAAISARQREMID